MESQHFARPARFNVCVNQCEVLRLCLTYKCEEFDWCLHSKVARIPCDIIFALLGRNSILPLLFQTFFTGPSRQN